MAGELGKCMQAWGLWQQLVRAGGTVFPTKRLGPTECCSIVLLWYRVYRVVVLCCGVCIVLCYFVCCVVILHVLCCGIILVVLYPQARWVY